MSSNKPGPVFIAGVFRSGTSLLYSLLNSHPRLALMFECDVWDFPEKLSRRRFRGNWLERQEFYNRALSRHRLIFGGRVSGIDAETPEALYRIFSEVKGAELWGEKSPFYCARLRQLARRYPDAAFILLWRDPIEIFRSVVRAGRDERFFRRPGMLNRLIHYQEQMIRQTRELERLGARVHHVTYSDLIDRTEDTCRGCCRFLGIDFDARMLDLTQADFSAIYRAPQHEHLRRGRIERQRFSEALAPAAVTKLERFRARWQRLAPWMNTGVAVAPRPEPSLIERAYHRVAGKCLWVFDNFKRALFEFLPLPWLSTYRRTARWLLARRDDATVPRPGLRDQILTHWITLAASALFLAGVATIDYFSGPHITLAPFYLVPTALLVLVVNREWGTVAAVISASVWSWLQWVSDAGSMRFSVLLWNTVMRFLVFEFIVLLLDRTRIEMNAGGEQQLK